MLDGRSCSGRRRRAGGGSGWRRFRNSIPTPGSLLGEPTLHLARKQRRAEQQHGCNAEEHACSALPRLSARPPSLERGGLAERRSYERQAGSDRQEGRSWLSCW